MNILSIDLKHVTWRLNSLTKGIKFVGVRFAIQKLLGKGGGGGRDKSPPFYSVKLCIYKDYTSTFMYVYIRFYIRQPYIKNIRQRYCCMELMCYPR